MKCPVFLTSATKGPRVRRDSRKKNGVVYRPGLLLAAVLLYVLLPGGSVSASSVLRSHGFDSEAHSHHCKCGPKCRGSSCCCGPTETTARPSAPEPIPQGREADTGPCLNSAPCGDSGLPSSPSVGPLGKVATLSMIGRVRPGTPGRLFPSSSRCIRPSRLASRIDEPPEGLVVA